MRKILKILNLSLITLIFWSSFALSKIDEKRSDLKVSSDIWFIKKIDIPVSWSTTVAFFKAKQAFSQTESFRDIWTLEIHKNGSMYLKSEGVSVEVFGQKTGAYGLPPSITLSQSSFAHLIGIEEATLANNQILEKDQLLTFKLSSASDDSEFILHISPERYYSVSLRIGQ